MGTKASDALKNIERRERGVPGSRRLPAAYLSPPSLLCLVVWAVAWSQGTCSARVRGAQAPPHSPTDADLVIRPTAPNSTLGRRAGGEHSVSQV